MRFVRTCRPKCIERLCKEGISVPPCLRRSAIKLQTTRLNFGSECFSAFRESTLPRGDSSGGGSVLRTSVGAGTVSGIDGVIRSVMCSVRNLYSHSVACFIRYEAIHSCKEAHAVSALHLIVLVANAALHCVGTLYTWTGTHRRWQCSQCHNWP